MSEINHKQCKVCSEVKLRIPFGTFTKKSNKRFVDSDGKLWNGLVCPTCQKARAKVNMSRLRESRKV